MAKCSSCSAPLPPNAAVCAYCGTRNEVDLAALHGQTAEFSESERSCPACGTPMRTINAEREEELLVEQCPSCFGLFFDPGELEALLDHSVSHVYEVDGERLGALAATAPPKPIRYVKCPVCGTLMNRLNFGSRSGVIVDVCKGHGVWLDGGELRQLLEWRKAGGQLHHEEVVTERLKEERLKQAREKAEHAASAASSWNEQYASRIEGGGLADLLGGLLSRFVS